MQNLGERIRLSRIRAGLTQEELAEQLEVSRVSVAKYEAGEMEPKLHKFKLLAEILNVSTDYLLGHRVRGVHVLDQLSGESLSALEIFLTRFLEENEV